MNIEQAIFTSARTERSDGYHLVLRSPGILDTDARALARWGPSHDSLMDSNRDAQSINFFSLPSGAYSVSRTVISGVEHSGRGGGRAYTHYLVITAEDMAEVECNPFTILALADSYDLLKIHDQLPHDLSGARLEKPDVDALMEGHFDSTPVMPEVLHLAQLISSRQRQGFGVVCVDDAIAITSAVFERLSGSTRSECSFSTGLRPSARRPFRIVFLEDSSMQQRRIARRFGIEACDLSSQRDNVAAPVG